MYVNIFNKKKNTKIITDYFSKIFSKYNIQYRTLIGYLISFVHFLLIIWIIIYLLFEKKIDKKYYFYLFIWIIIIYSNYYFHGCIISKIEREILKDNNWCGPISIIINSMKNQNTTINSNTFILYFSSLIITLIIFSKISLTSTFIFILFLVPIIIYDPNISFNNLSYIYV